MKLSFKLQCQRYQIYKDRRRGHKSSILAQNETTNMYQDEIRKQSAVNDRRNNRTNGKSLKRKASSYLTENIKL